MKSKWWWLLIPALLVARVKITVSQSVENQQDLEGEVAKREMEVILLTDKLKAFKKIVDTCFEAYGDWAVGDFVRLKARLPELWQELGEYDKERALNTVRQRLAEKEKVYTYEEVMK